MRRDEPRRIGEGAPSGAFWARVRDWQVAQPWHGLLHSEDPDERAEGRAALSEAWDRFQREANQAGQAYLASKDRVALDTRLDALGIGAALAAEIRDLSPQRQPEAVTRALTWWQRGKTPLLVVAGTGDARIAQLVAGTLVWRASGRLVHANELQRRQREDRWVEGLLSTRLLCIEDLFVAGDERIFVENLLAELLQVRGAAGHRTVLVTPLDRTGLLGVVSGTVRDRLCGDGATWLGAVSR